MRPPARPGSVGSRWYCKTSWLLLVVVFLCVCLLVVGNYALQLRRSCETREASTLESLRTAQAYSTASEGEVKRLQAQVAYLTDSANAPVEGARRRVAAPPGGGSSSGRGSGEEGEVGGKQGEEGEKGKAGTGGKPQQQQRHTGGGALVAAVERAPLRPAPRESWGVVASGVEASPVSPSSARALLVICYNRPAYLKRTLRAVLSRLPTYDRPHVYISQDGDDGEVSAAIGELAGEFASAAPDVPFTHWHHPAVSPKLRGGGAVDGWAVSYYKLAQHFGWALERLFSERNHPYVIVLEDDLEVAVDFFQYFSAMAPLLDADDTLLAVSSYSDLGQPAFVGDPRQVHRSDFFPGLGWMLNRRVWKQDLGPKWPDSFWDDWLREPPQRKGRHILRPEVSRTLTFGENGVSQSQFFSQYLATVKLNEEAVDWAGEDLQYLQPSVWAREFQEALEGAREVKTLEEFHGAKCGTQGEESVKFGYGKFEAYPAVAHKFGYIDDAKAGVPRTAFEGVVTVVHNGCRKFATPST